MKQAELARQVAARSRVTRAQACDQVDEVVRKILKSLRRGQAVELPGVGRLLSDAAEVKAGDVKNDEPRSR